MSLVGSELAASLAGGIRKVGARARSAAAATFVRSTVAVALARGYIFIRRNHFRGPLRTWC